MRESGTGELRSSRRRCG